MEANSQPRIIKQPLTQDEYHILLDLIIIGNRAALNKWIRPELSQSIFALTRKVSENLCYEDALKMWQVLIYMFKQ